MISEVTDIELSTNYGFDNAKTNSITRCEWGEPQF